MAEQFSEADETRGLALFGRLMSASTLLLLRRKGIISDDETAFTVDLVLSQLEALQTKHPNDRAVQVARQALGEMLAILPLSRDSAQPQ